MEKTVLQPDIDTLSSLFRNRFSTFVRDLQTGAHDRGRHVMVTGDLQVAPTELDESVSLSPPSRSYKWAKKLDYL